MTATLTKTARPGGKQPDPRTPRRTTQVGRWPLRAMGLALVHGPSERPPPGTPVRGVCHAAWFRDRAEEIAGQIRQLEASLAPQVQGALW